MVQIKSNYMVEQMVQIESNQIVKFDKNFQFKSITDGSNQIKFCTFKCFQHFSNQIKLPLFTNISNKIV